MVNQLLEEDETVRHCDENWDKLHSGLQFMHKKKVILLH